jgi:hypothetical protein
MNDYFVISYDISRVDKDMTSTHQITIPKTIILSPQLISLRRPKTSYPPHPVHLLCTYSPKFTNLRTQVNSSSLLVVVPANSSPISMIVSWYPLIRIQSYFKDTKYALQILKNIHFHGTQKFFFTMYVKSLYTL